MNVASTDLTTCGSDRTTLELLVAFADVLQHRHEFAMAEKLLGAVLERDRRHAQARLMRATIRFAAGRPKDALTDCKTVFGVVDAVVASACAAQSLALTGQLDQAYALISRVTDDLPAQTDPGIAWALAIRAEIEERCGDAVGASTTILRAVAADPTSYPTRLQAADLLIRASRYVEALQAIELLPPTEPVLLRRALAARGVDVARSKALTVDWRELMKRERDLRAPLHLRDLARGHLELLNDPTSALAAAKENWKSQRELEDARIFLAAASAAGRPEESQPVRLWLAENRIEDALINRLMARGDAL